VSGDLHLGADVRVFAQFLSALATGRAEEPGFVDQNQLDLAQAFFDLSHDLPGGARATIRFGRQELSYGSGRLIDVRAGPNVPRTFNGGRLILTFGNGWRVDGIAVRPTDLQTGVFDDGIDESQALWGFYAVGTVPWLPTSLDFYYLGYHNDDSTYEQGTAAETRHTLGVRVWGERTGWDWNLEFIGQWGTFGSGTIQAWSVASDTGYTWHSVAWSPRLGLSANVASGDKNPTQRNLQTFNPLFPRGNYFSELSLLGPRNFFNVHPFVTVSPHRTVVFTADVDFFWRLQKGDGVYSPSGQLLRAGTSADPRYVSTELSLSATWQVNPHVGLTAIYSHSFPGGFIRATGPSKPIDFVEMTFRALF